MDNNEIRDKTLGVAPDDIDLIVLFGSRARGDSHQFSDTDIAVSIPDLDKERRFRIRLRVISQFEGPRKKVDVVVIEDANWSLKYRIARDGIVLYEKTGNEWTTFIERVSKYYPDYKIFVEQYLKQAMEDL